MHWLSSPAPQSRGHQTNIRRPRAERGVTAVVVAIVMVMLVGFAAIAVDVGALWWDKKQLQNGADAGALALAQACAQGEDICPTGPNDEDSTATGYAKSNDLAARDDTKGKVYAIDLDGGSVTVETGTVRDAWFSRIWGNESSHVPAQSTARWGAPLRASVLPITAATCGFDELGSDPFGKPVDVVFKDSHDMAVLPLLADNKTVDCAKIVKDGMRDYAGGFGWLAQGDIACKADIDLATMVGPGKPGVTNASCFQTLVERLKKPGEVVEVEFPVFDQVPAHKLYHISGFVTLKVTAVCFKDEYPSKTWCKATNDAEGRSNSALFIRGEFVKRTTLSTAGGGGPTPYGTNVVWLSWD